MKKQGLVLSAIIMGFVYAVSAPYVAQRPVAYAQDDWKSDFDEICSKTDDAMTLKKDELKSLIERCDKLKQRIDKLDESSRKVYLKRIQMCRDLFAFVLDSKSER